MADWWQASACLTDVQMEIKLDWLMECSKEARINHPVERDSAFVKVTHLGYSYGCSKEVPRRADSKVPWLD